MKVAFQGAHGAYSELAANGYFSKPIQTLPLAEFSDVFRAVTKGRAQYGIVPIENSLTGSIHQNYDLLLRHDLWICGETKLRITHSLLAHPESNLKAIKKIYSHPQALWQCQRFLKTLKGIDVISHFDTAGSAKFIAQEDSRDSAAIASRLAAEHYGLKVLKVGIEDNRQNFTRFLVLSRKEKEIKSQGDCKTSVVFGLRSVPGALHSSLKVFAEKGVQIFRVESRPIPGKPWEYLFYLDFAGRSKSKETRTLLRDLKKLTTQLKLLGSYPIV